MQKAEMLERLQELMHERENLTREHEDLSKKDKLLTEQLEIILNPFAKHGAGVAFLIVAHWW